MAKRMVLLVGTNKGVFMYTADANRKEWSLKGPFLPGWEVYSVLGDSRHGNRIYAGTSHAAYGATIRVSDDFGESWTQVEHGPSYSKESGFSLNRIWQIAPGHPSEPDTVFAGVEEAGIFVSRDRGATWRELDVLTKHPSRPGWFPGAGGMCLHTILIDPRNPKRMWVGISAVGVFRTDDGGETWTPRNQGLARVPTGQPQEDVGFCVHKIVLDPFNPDIMYMQEHGGVFQSNDGGDNWFTIEEGVTLREGDMPFGFPIVVAPNGDLFLVPLESSEQRAVAEGKLLVYGRHKGDTSWAPVGDAMPDEPRHVSVLRDAMTIDAFDPYGLYFGTTSGEVFCSLDRGRTWDRLPGQLSRILCVKPWVVED
ncbi:WD40/YVTN/BNR-like repeat-containing protein [Cohnella candidum]|uniref:Exo-alpha-sialidase n=1 Tax=Cohnella candidum TaxID=2674991 RepID=A0A3G3K157_9BACL|nr:exo-alpha-sialidase [Cohnella candidum]AYQ74284.1 exo-alpha-sialidase [Cohnella candidum]